jgi:NADPH-dependent 2,4-dienoyl-CoA reductase/sulfur reductase-like enzyme
MAAALSVNKLNVTMIYPSGHLCHRVFPEDLGLAMEDIYRSRGTRILKGETPVSFEKKDSGFIIHSSGGETIQSDMVIVGTGIKPAAELAEKAGLTVDDGILVNGYLQTVYPDIYAAGDNAGFPCQALGQQMHMEHWDNALSQGKHAGKNMAGAHEPFTALPYFFSDLFKFGYEAVGEVDSRMETIADWSKPFDTGVIYYTRDGVIRGVMMCNVWGKADEARALIRRKAGMQERLS